MNLKARHIKGQFSNVKIKHVVHKRVKSKSRACGRSIFKSESRACRGKTIEFKSKCTFTKSNGIIEIGIDFINKLYNEKFKQFLDVR